MMYDVVLFADGIVTFDHKKQQAIMQIADFRKDGRAQ